MGLAFDVLDTIHRAPTVVSNLVKQKQMAPLFSFHLTSNPNDQSIFVLGGVDDTKFTSDICCFPVKNSTVTPEPSGLWTILLDDALVDNEPLWFNGRDAVIDTGTSAILIPQKDADLIHSRIQGAQFIAGFGVYVIPCDTTSTVSLVFGGNNYTIQTADLIMENLGGNFCVSSILPSSFKFWLLGVPFLKSVYSVFDIGAKCVGFAV